MLVRITALWNNICFLQSKKNPLLSQSSAPLLSALASRRCFGSSNDPKNNELEEVAKNTRRVIRSENQTKPSSTEGKDVISDLFPPIIRESSVKNQRQQPQHRQRHRNSLNYNKNQGRRDADDQQQSHQKYNNNTGNRRFPQQKNYGSDRQNWKFKNSDPYNRHNSYNNRKLQNQDLNTKRRQLKDSKSSQSLSSPNENDGERLNSLMESLKMSAQKHTSSTTTGNENRPSPPIPSFHTRISRRTEEVDSNNRLSSPMHTQRNNLDGFRWSFRSDQKSKQDHKLKNSAEPSSPSPGYRMPPRKYNNNSQNYRRGRPIMRDGMDFLEGRLTRANQNEKEESEPRRNQDQTSTMATTRLVTLPAAGLDLIGASSLFRIKVDDIERALKAAGLMTMEKDNEESLVQLDIDTLELLAMDFGIETQRGEEEIIMDSEELLINQRRADDAITFPPRPPVVCIMGHVDHGKTTLMDALRRRSESQKNVKSKKKKSKGKKGKGASASTTADVAGTEAGGITQIISAFQVEVEEQGNLVTFLDTPGHAAFKDMRQSGSHAADVIVLVIAADDGVSEQTIEILNFYKSIVKGSNGGITMVVALNKIDKPGIEVEEAQQRIENQLLEQGITCEGMGGDSEYGPPVQVIPTSGLTGLGLDELMEGLILQSEVMDLRADHEAHAEGIVMDARMEKGLGVVADCIIRWGSIEKGSHIVSGTQASRVRMLKDVNDKMLKRGMPSQPVRIVGFKSLPKAGDPIICVDSEEIAEEMVEQRANIGEESGSIDGKGKEGEVEIHISGMRKMNTRRVAKFRDLAGLEENDGTIRIPIIVKADADASLSAVRDSLVSLGIKSTHKVNIDPIQTGIGDITPTDIQMAKESDACIFAFGLKRIDPAMRNLAEAEGVTIQSDNIIYSLLDDAKETLGKYLPQSPFEEVHGKGSIQAIFVVDGEAGEEKVAGLKVTEGNLYRRKNTNSIPTHFRVYRNGEMISPASESVTARSLRRFKELVDSVRHGDECGLALLGFDEFIEGDEIECYSVEMKNSKL